MRRQAGYSLIELSSVIVTLTVLAGAAISSLVDLTGQSEMSVVQELRSSLQTAMVMYYGETGTIPDSFADFVTTAKNAAPAVSTIDISPIGDGDCEIRNGNMISCPKAFETIAIAMYAFDNCMIKIRIVNQKGNPDGENGNQMSDTGNQFEGCNESTSSTNTGNSGGSGNNGGGNSNGGGNNNNGGGNSNKNK